MSSCGRTLSLSLLEARAPCTCCNGMDRLTCSGARIAVAWAQLDKDSISFEVKNKRLKKTRMCPVLSRSRALGRHILSTRRRHKPSMRGWGCPSDSALATVGESRLFLRFVLGDFGFPARPSLVRSVAGDARCFGSWALERPLSVLRSPKTTRLHGPRCACVRWAFLPPAAQGQLTRMPGSGAAAGSRLYPPDSQ